MSFNSLLYNKLVLALTVDMIIQSEREKGVEKQISGKKFYNMSDFKLQISQRIIFCIMTFTTRQILSEVR